MDGLYGDKATQEEKISKGIRGLLGKTVQKRLMPPYWTASLLLLHMANELLVFSAVMPKKSRNIFAKLSESLGKRIVSGGFF